MKHAQSKQNQANSKSGRRTKRGTSNKPNSRKKALAAEKFGGPSKGRHSGNPGRTRSGMESAGGRRGKRSAGGDAARPDNSAELTAHRPDTAHAYRPRGRKRRGSADTASFGAKSFKRKNEWMEGLVPEGFSGESLGRLLRRLSMPPKLAGKMIEKKEAMLAGNLLRLRLFPKEDFGIAPDWMELNILYEDDFLLAVNKPAGLEVHPSESGQRRTLANAVAAYYEASGQACRVRPLHRIDKDTTGPVLFAKNEWAQQVMDKALRHKQLDRRYLALAEGVVRDKQGVIDKPIGQDRHHSTRRRVSDTGERAVTRYEVAERFKDHTLLRLQLETGRTHQIRVHLSAIGHPIAGDGMYGGGRRIITRQALHGETLHWHHPWNREPLEVRAPLPDDFMDALRRLRES